MVFAAVAGETNATECPQRPISDLLRLLSSSHAIFLGKFSRPANQSVDEIASESIDEQCNL